MTTQNYNRYLIARQELLLTTKSIILVGYWTIRKINWIRISGYCAILLALQTLTNAMVLHSTAMVFISIVFVGIGLRIIKLCQQ